MRALCLVLSLALLLPAAVAGAPFQHSSTIGAGAFAATAEKRYFVQASEGEWVVATLTWNDPDARLFLSASVPGCSCPLTDVGCTANAVQTHEICSTTSAGSRWPSARAGATA